MVHLFARSTGDLLSFKRRKLSDDLKNEAEKHTYFNAEIKWLMVGFTFDFCYSPSLLFFLLSPFLISRLPLKTRHLYHTGRPP